MTSWVKVRLGDVCEFKYGKSLAAVERSGSGVEVFGSNGVVGYHHQALTEGPTIVVGRKGSLGEVNYSAKPCWPIDTTYFVDSTCTDADLRWLSHRLSGLALTKLNRAAAVPGLNRDDAYRLQFLLPPLEIQRSISHVLDSADALRATRRATLALLDSLTSAVFLEMFGQPSSHWLVTTVAGLAGSASGAIRTGPFGSQLLHSEFVATGIAVLGIDNAVTNEFAWSGLRFVSEDKYRQLVRYTVYPGDVLITIMGTLGRCAVVPDDIPPAISTKHLCCITPDREKCLPDFLQAYFLHHPLARRYLGQTAKGAIMSGLNMAIIKEMPIAVPPIALQKEFARRRASIGGLKLRLQASAAALDELFASLQHQAFNGDLNCSATDVEMSAK